MSIDLDWAKLDSTLASSLVDVLNRQLQSAPRPSFIGPVQITSFDFGTQAPDVELVDLCDIHRDFLDDDDADDQDADPVKVTEGPDIDDDEGFEWVSRRAAGLGVADDAGPAYHLLPPHVRYGRGPASDMFASAQIPPHDGWGGPMAMSMPALSPRTSYLAQTAYNSPAARTPLSAAADPHSHFATRHPSPTPPSSLSTSPSPPESGEPSPGPAQPNLQIHLHTTWHSNLRLSLTTSLRINYPSPMFMALPIRLAVTGLVFTGEVAVAYEGARGRVHLSILDEMDPYAPRRVGRRAATGSAGSETPSEDVEGGSGHGSGAGGPRADKPLPVGQRLLPSIYIESELGQADKHVLKNVARVERFIQDVIRKTVEEELVFPNFHTLVLS